ncbi:MAG: dockerin type I repeat-containing protein [Ruminococcus sp.]
MKRILSFCLVITIVILMCFHVGASVKSSYKYYPDGTVYFHCDNSNDYFVSFSGNDIIINSIGKGYKKITAESDVIKCNYAGGNFYFFLKPENHIPKAIKFNYSTGSIYTTTFSEIKDNGYLTCSVDNKGYYYIAEYKSRQKVYKCSQQGNIVKAFNFDMTVSQIDTNDGTTQFVLTSLGLYKIQNDTVTKVNCEYPGFPMTMINKNYFAADNIVRDISKNGNEICPYKSGKTAILNNGFAYSEGKTIYYTPYGKDNPQKYYKADENINYLFGSGEKICFITDGGAYKISTNELKTIESNNKSTDSTGNGTISDGGKITSNTYTIGNKYIKNVPPKTTISTFKNNVSYDGYEISFLYNGSVKTSGYVSTNMDVTFSNNTIEISRKIIVTGDITCDGKVNSKDTSLLMKYLLGTSPLNNICKQAGNVTGNGKLNNADLVAIAQMRE